MIYLLILICLGLSALSLLQWLKLKLWKMEQDLEDWIGFGTGDDIIRCKEQRKEYQHYVNICEKAETLKINIPKSVVKLIRQDLHDKSLIKPIYIYLLILKVKGYKI